MRYTEDVTILDTVAVTRRVPMQVSVKRKCKRGIRKGSVVSQNVGKARGMNLIVVLEPQMRYQVFAAQMTHRVLKLH